jgi:hypothetical protein
MPGNVALVRGADMSDRLFAIDGGSSPRERPLVAMVAIAVYDCGAQRDRSERYEAQLAGYAVVHGRGASPWEAVRHLVGGHRALLERRWSGGVGL